MGIKFRFKSNYCWDEQLCNNEQILTIASWTRGSIGKILSGRCPRAPGVTRHPRGTTGALVVQIQRIRHRGPVRDPAVLVQPVDAR